MSNCFIKTDVLDKWNISSSIYIYYLHFLPLKRTHYQFGINVNPVYKLKSYLRLESNICYISASTLCIYKLEQSPKRKPTQTKTMHRRHRPKSMCYVYNSATLRRILAFIRVWPAVYTVYNLTGLTYFRLLL